MYIFVIEKLVKLCEEIRGENGAEQQEESTTVNVRLDDMTASESEGEVSEADVADESSADESDANDSDDGKGDEKTEVMTETKLGGSTISDNEEKVTAPVDEKDKGDNKSNASDVESEEEESDHEASDDESEADSDGELSDAESVAREVVKTAADAVAVVGNNEATDESAVSDVESEPGDESEASDVESRQGEDKSGDELSDDENVAIDAEQTDMKKQTCAATTGDNSGTDDEGKVSDVESKPGDDSEVSDVESEPEDESEASDVESEPGEGQSCDAVSDSEAEGDSKEQVPSGNAVAANSCNGVTASSSNEYSDISDVESEAEGEQGCVRASDVESNADGNGDETGADSDNKELDDKKKQQADKSEITEKEELQEADCVAESDNDDDDDESDDISDEDLSADEVGFLFVWLLVLKLHTRLICMGSVSSSTFIFPYFRFFIAVCQSINPTFDPQTGSISISQTYKLTLLFCYQYFCHNFMLLGVLQVICRK